MSVPLSLPFFDLSLSDSWLHPASSHIILIHSSSISIGRKLVDQLFLGTLKSFFIHKKFFVSFSPDAVPVYSILISTSGVIPERTNQVTGHFINTNPASPISNTRFLHPLHSRLPAVPKDTASVWS